MLSELDMETSGKVMLLCVCMMNPRQALLEKCKCSDF